MTNHLSRFSYLEHRLSREVLELFLSVAFQDFAVALFALFEPIYLYSIGYSLPRIVAFYLIIYVVYFAILPLGGKFAERFGFEHSIGASFVFLFLYLLALYFIPSIPLLFYVAPVVVAVYKILYWPSYHANFSKYGKRKAFGKEVGLASVVYIFVNILGPLIGGFIVQWFGFPVLFFVVALILLLAVVPMFTTKERFTRKSFSYIDSYRFFFSKAMRRLTVSLMGLSNEIIEVVIWPIFLFVIVREYSSLGIIGSIAGIGGAFIVLFVGKAADLRKRSTLIHAFSWPQVLGFLLRLFVHSPFFALLVSTFSTGAKRGSDVVLYSAMYEGGRKVGSMKMGVFFEMAFAFSKMLILLVLFLLFLFLPSTSSFTVAFVLGAFVSLLFLLFR